MEIVEVDPEDVALLGLRGRPRDYTKSKYYPAIEGALEGKVMAIQCNTDREAHSLYNSLNQVIRRNKLQLVLCSRKESVYVYKKKDE